jgi:hypothetical protein
VNADTNRAGAEPAVTGSWRKSSFSGDQGACVEFAPSTAGVAIRDSKLGETSPILHFTPTEMKAMLDGAKAGEFDDLAAG